MARKCSHLLKKGNSPLKIALEFGVNIHCQGSASLLSIILNIAEILFVLKFKNITPEVKIAR